MDEPSVMSTKRTAEAFRTDLTQPQTSTLGTGVRVSQFFRSAIVLIDEGARSEAHAEYHLGVTWRLLERRSREKRESIIWLVRCNPPTAHER